ncbi:MAG: NUDIX domain-containing protein, partial [Acutalibacteraceae bacterium]
MDNKFTVCGLVLIDEKVLLVRHTYGVAKGRILLPGGHVMSGEMPNAAAEREILEEAGVSTTAKSIISARFKPNEWLLVFEMDY